MKTRRLFVALMFAGAFVLLATSKNAIVNASNVTIVSIDAHSLVVSRTIKGKAELLHFILNATTVRKGKLEVGSKVTVHYTTQNNENTATSIQSREPNSSPPIRANQRSRRPNAPESSEARAPCPPKLPARPLRPLPQRRRRLPGARCPRPGKSRRSA